MSLTELLTSLENATAADLEVLDAEITQKEVHVAMLKEVRRILRVRFGLTSAPSSRLPKTKAKTAELTPTAAPEDLSQTDRYRQAVYRYIMANGPASQAALCKALNIPDGSMTAVISHKWFHKTTRGIDLRNS
jgi:hypothetical protein